METGPKAAKERARIGAKAVATTTSGKGSGKGGDAGKVAKAGAKVSGAIAGARNERVRPLSTWDVHGGAPRRLKKQKQQNRKKTNIYIYSPFVHRVYIFNEVSVQT